MSRKVLLALVLALMALGHPPRGEPTFAPLVSGGLGKAGVALDLNLRVESESSDIVYLRFGVRAVADLGPVEFRILLPRGWVLKDGPETWTAVLAQGEIRDREMTLRSVPGGGTVAVLARMGRLGLVRQAHVTVGRAPSPPPAAESLDSAGRPVCLSRALDPEAGK
jgi:hypothetical protein